MEKNNTKLNKIYKILRIILIVFVLFNAIKSCAKAYTQQNLEDYLEYWKFETDNGSTEWGTNTAISNLYNLYANDYDRFTQIYQYLSSETTAVSCGVNVTSSNRKFYILRGPTGNFSSGTTWNSVGIVRKLQSTITSTGETWGSMGTSGTDNFTQNQIFVFNSSANDALINIVINNKNVASQKQWLFTLNRSNNILQTTDNNIYVTAFDIRIGQDWNIADTTIRIYTIENEQKNYRIITHKFRNANASNQYIVDFLKDDLPNGTYTYGIDLLYRGKVWKTTDTTEYQRINKTSSGSNGGNISSGETGGNVNINLTGITNAINNLTNKVVSGDNKIIATLESGEKKAEERDNFWRETYNALFTLNSGDIAELQTKISGELAKLTSGDSNFAEEKEILDMIYATEPRRLNYRVGSDNIPRYNNNTKRRYKL